MKKSSQLTHALAAIAFNLVFMQQPVVWCTFSLSPARRRSLVSQIEFWRFRYPALCLRCAALRVSECYRPALITRALPANLIQLPPRRSLQLTCWLAGWLTLSATAASLADCCLIFVRPPALVGVARTVNELICI